MTGKLKVRFYIQLDYESLVTNDSTDKGKYHAGYKA
jgi:hypothetical protein